MHHLGHTRSAHCANHLLQTPDAFVQAPLPGMRNCVAIVHIGPAGGAAFTEYTAIFEPGGVLGIAAGQRFVYVLEGELEFDGKALTAGGYCYQPAGSEMPVKAKSASRAVAIEKPYAAVANIDGPGAFTGNEADCETKPLDGDDALGVRSLIPADPAFDFAVNTMTFQPGSSLSRIEIHIMEHGLLMLDGGGIYRLGDSWYPVQQGDFIWMAPYCPQWFGALGKTPARYLIYKDWNRHPIL